MIKCVIKFSQDYKIEPVNDSKYSILVDEQGMMAKLLFLFDNSMIGTAQLFHTYFFI